MDIYLVGGAVRDKLLNIPVRERDYLVVGGTPEEMMAEGFKPVGKDFPVFLHPETGAEYALARKERKHGQGYGGFTFYTTPDISLEEDLLRRDLTINAMAEDALGQLIDPYNGRRDLEAHLLRHVSGAFVEDPLRVLRVARFAARFSHLGFRVAPETMELMGTIAESGELAFLTPERVWREMEIALGEPSPDTFIETLRECGALGKLLPEVNALFGVPQRADYHPEVDTGIHILMCLKIATSLSEETEVRFAVLMHDLGKGVTPPDILPKHIGHEEAGVPLVNAVCERYKIPARYRELAVLVSRHHLLCHKAKTLRPATVLKLLNKLDAFRRPERFKQFLLACESDARGRLGFENTFYEGGGWLAKAYREAAAVTAAEFIAKGLKGPDVGRAIDKRRLELIRQLEK